MRHWLSDCGVLDYILTTAQRGEASSPHCTAEKGKAPGSTLVRVTPLRLHFRQNWGCSAHSRAVLGHMWRSALLLATFHHSRIGRHCHHVCPWSLPPKKIPLLVGKLCLSEFFCWNTTLLCTPPPALAQCRPSVHRPACPGTRYWLE